MDNPKNILRRLTMKRASLILILLLLMAALLIGAKSMGGASLPVKKAYEEVIREPEPEAPAFEEKEEIELTADICFMGDVMMDSYIKDYIDDYGIDYPLSKVSHILKAADVSVINLETSVSTRGKTKKPKGYGFRSHPDTLGGLKNAGIDLVSLGNNHVFDFGEEAFYDTLENLNKYGIEYAGAGRNIREAERLVIIEKNGIKLGFAACNMIIPWEGWSASDNSPGTASVLKGNYNRILNNINEYKKECDVLSILVHWGREYAKVPDEWQIELAHLMIDSGADIIVGQHPHVLQGIEIYKEKPIIYSTGNFVFLKNDDECGRTGIFKVTVTRKGFKEGQFFPVHISLCRANLLDGSKGMGREIIDSISRLSMDFGTIIDSSGKF